MLYFVLSNVPSDVLFSVMLNIPCSALLSFWVFVPDGAFLCSVKCSQLCYNPVLYSDPGGTLLHEMFPVVL